MSPILIGMMLFAGAALADTHSPPFALAARIEQVWSKLDVPEHNGTKQYDGDVMVSIVPSFELRENIYLFGRASYPIQTELPQFVVGLEVKIY